MPTSTCLAIIFKSCFRFLSAGFSTTHFWANLLLDWSLATERTQLLITTKVLLRIQHSKGEGWVKLQVADWWICVPKSTMKSFRPLTPAALGYMIDYIIGLGLVQLCLSLKTYYIGIITLIGRTWCWRSRILGWMQCCRSGSSSLARSTRSPADGRTCTCSLEIK